MSADGVMMANVYSAVGQAASRGEWAAKREMARHLRHEHGWGIRKINRRLGMSDAEVKRAVGEVTP